MGGEVKKGGEGLDEIQRRDPRFEEVGMMTSLDFALASLVSHSVQNPASSNMKPSLILSIDLLRSPEGSPRLPVSILALLLFLFSCPSTSAASPPPNVLLILCDDLGYGDPQCYNAASKIPTPHIDRLAAGGVRFTDAHTPSSVCTPTRYGLLTGRYSWRTSLKKGVLDGFDPPLIESGRMTIASMLKAQGYDTACIGKWHLGLTWFNKQGQPIATRTDGPHRDGSEVDYTRELRGGPMDCGFDLWFGLSASLDMSPYAFIRERRFITPPSIPTPESKSLTLNQVAGMAAPGFELDQVLGTLTKEAVSYIAAHTEKPFFLYLPLTSPHLPVVPSKAWQGKTGAGDYADFVAETDDCVGQLMNALDAGQLAENTIIIFTTDNGGLWHQWQPKETDDLAHYKPTPRAAYNAKHGHYSNAELRGTKADIWEGGHRVPFIVRWPAKAKPAVNASLIELNDILATLAEITGTSLPTSAAEDSHSFLPTLLDATQPARSFAVHHSLEGVFSLRDAQWKYVPQRGSGGFTKPKLIQPGPQLYDLSVDPSETKNLAAEHPEIIERMAKRLTEIQTHERTR